MKNKADISTMGTPSTRIIEKKTFAEKADKFRCYQKAVQSPDHEVKFFEQAFREGIGARFAGRIEVDYAFQELGE